MTTATWMRHFVTTHPDYKHDSIVTAEIAYDLMKECHEISVGLKACPHLLGDNVIEPMPTEALYNIPLTSKTERSAEVSDLISRYAERADIANKKRKLHRDILAKEEELSRLKA